MTAQYWSRKLDGGYVWHGNKYKQIDGLQVRIPDDAHPRFEYPEDYLPHIQFNMVDSRVLRDAQEHPENYTDLLVRVAGYSAFWIDLPREAQDSIIARADQGLS